MAEFGDRQWTWHLWIWPRGIRRGFISFPSPVCFSEFPLAAETILKSTYMHDSMDSVPGVKTTIELYNQSSGALPECMPGSEGRVESLNHLWLIELEKSKHRPILSSGDMCRPNWTHLIYLQEGLVSPLLLKKTNGGVVQPSWSKILPSGRRTKSKPD